MLSSLLMYGVGTTALLAAAYRFRSARGARTPGVVHLCGAIAGVGLSAVLSAPSTLAAAAPIEPIPNVTRLLANDLAMVAAWCVQGLLLHLVLPPERASAALRRQTVVLVIGIGTMSALLTVEPVPYDPEFVATYADVPAVLGYIVVFCGYIGWSQLSFIRLIRRYIRLSDRPWLRAGLTVIQLGCASALGWALSKSAASVLVFARHGDSTGIEASLSTLFSATCVGLVAFGATMPGWGPLLTGSLCRIRQHHAHRALAPLWSVLRPVVAEADSSSSSSPIPGSRRIEWRLTRRVVDIRDALLFLAPYRPAPNEVTGVLLAHPADPEASAAAVGIVRALRKWHSGESPMVRAPRVPEPTEIDDLDTEIAWLKRVARSLPTVYTSEPEAPVKPVRVQSRTATITTTCAHLLTEVFAPWVLVLLLPLMVAWRATDSLIATLLWGLLVALTSSLLPMGVIVWGARTGRWDGHHVRDRAGRLIPFLVLLGSSGLGLGLLIVLRSPWLLIALDITMVLTLLVTGVITIRWKISMHTAVAAGAVVILAVTLGPGWWASAPLLAAIGWSRVAVNDHTTAQVTAGTIAGLLAGGGYALLV
ncbi:hypothetical protein J2S53_001190 [Actinopolyspora lacussalsi]|nr:hypothetical protein [Actinopolyspora lacussalsi]